MSSHHYRTPENDGLQRAAAQGQSRAAVCVHWQVRENGRQRAPARMSRTEAGGDSSEADMQSVRYVSMSILKAKAGQQRTCERGSLRPGVRQTLELCAHSRTRNSLRHWPSVSLTRTGGVARQHARLRHETPIQPRSHPGCTQAVPAVRVLRPFASRLSGFNHQSRSIRL
jgi:hypothetical protein